MKTILWTPKENIVHHQWSNCCFQSYMNIAKHLMACQSTDPAPTMLYRFCPSKVDLHDLRTQWSRCNDSPQLQAPHAVRNHQRLPPSHLFHRPSSPDCTKTHLEATPQIAMAMPLNIHCSHLPVGCPSLLPSFWALQPFANLQGFSFESNIQVVIPTPSK